MTDVVAVVDAGTSSIRAALVDESGRIVSHSAVPIEVVFPTADGAEQDPFEMRSAVFAALRSATTVAPDARVVAVTVSAQRASVLIADRDGTPRTPFQLWMDRRGAQALPELDGCVGAERFSEITGLPFGAMPGVTRVLRVRAEHRQLLDDARLVGVQDWVTGCLIGEAAPVDPSCAGWTGLYSPDAGSWSRELVDALGLDPELLPEVRDSWSTAGSLTAAAAASVGIPAGVPVLVGGGDQQCSSLGAGAVRPGQSSLNVGTSATFVLPARASDATPRGAVRTGHVIPGLEDREGTIPSCGSALEWLHDAFGSGESIADLLRRAENVRPGADGVRCVPALAGLGTPTWVPVAGWMEGLTPATGRDHIVRAALEGIALQFRDVIEAFAATGQRPESVSLIGGAARSETFGRILADLGGVPVQRPVGDPQDAAVRGAAASAWFGAGRFDDLGAAVVGLLRELETWDPDPDERSAADALYGEYLAMRDHVAERHYSTSHQGELTR